MGIVSPNRSGGSENASLSRLRELWSWSLPPSLVQKPFSGGTIQAFVDEGEGEGEGDTSQ